MTGNLINGGAASTANTLITLAPGKSVPAGVTFDARTGDVGVAAGTADGTYIIEYQLCEALNPTNCGVAAISVAVVNASPSASTDTATVVRGNSVTINVLANDNEPGGDPITVRSTTTPANGIVTINGDSTLTFTPNASFTGADSFRYTVCDPARQCASADVNVTVQSSVAAITGTVFLNTDGNQTMDPSDPHQPNWLVEVVRNNAVIATARTDADGRYEITDLPLGSGYSLLLQHPTTRVVYARSDQITLNAGISSIVLNRPIDPSGVIYDSIARTAIAGARVSIAEANGTLLPSTCVLDPSQQNQLTASDGRYRIDIIAGAAVQCPVGETVYRLVVTGPADTIDGRSTVILADTGPFDPTGLSSAAVAPNSAAPQAGESTRHFFTFRLASGDPDVTNNHVPLDRAGALNPLIVTVTSPKRTANVGDLVPYTIVVRNTQNVARTAIDLIDTVPPGFKYVRDSGLINATPIAPEANGRDIAWRKLTLPANGSLTISLMLTIGAGVNDGDYVNSAVSRDSRQANVVSNVGQATVRVAPSPLFDCAEIIGKVFEDANGNGVQDDGEPGIASARVATVNGLLITADQYGRYHVTCASVPNAQIGSNFILKLDLRSLPSGHRITTENPRVIRLTRGKISELNFGAQATRVTTIDLSSVAFIGETTALTPDWHAKLPALIANLKATGSTLQLLYVGTPGEEGRATERLTALARQLEALWRKTGRSDDLLIERTFISANLTPTTITGKE